MKPFALDIDHIGIAVGNLDVGEKAIRSLGFHLTPRSYHRGSRTPGAPIEEWGSANHCAMLVQGYVELVGLTDPEKFSSVKSMLDGYEGTHIVALQPESVQLVHDALAEQGVAVDDIRDLERMTAFGPNGNEQRRVAFRNMYLTRTVFTEACFQYTEHLTRDAMWQSHLLDHPNGAIAVRQLFLCSEQSRVTAERLAPMLKVPPVPMENDEYELRLSNSRLVVLSRAAWERWAPATPLPPLPAPVGLGIEVKSLSHTRAVLRSNGVQARDGRHGGIWVHACNTVLYFSEAGA